MKTERAFSLIEVAISLGVVAFAFVAIIGLIPVGLAASRGAIDDTRGSLIARDAINRSRPIITGTNGATSQKWFYDGEGRYLDQTGNNPATLYCALVTGVAMQGSPNSANFSVPQTNAAGQLCAGLVSIGWPVNPTTGSVIGAASNAARITYPFYLRNQWP